MFDRKIELDAIDLQVSEHVDCLANLNIKISEHRFGTLYLFSDTGKIYIPIVCIQRLFSIY